MKGCIIPRMLIQRTVREHSVSCIFAMRESERQSHYMPPIGTTCHTTPHRCKLQQLQHIPRLQPTWRTSQLMVAVRAVHAAHRGLGSQRCCCLNSSKHATCLAASQSGFSEHLLLSAESRAAQAWRLQHIHCLLPSVHHLTQNNNVTSCFGKGWTRPAAPTTKLQEAPPGWQHCSARPHQVR